MAVKMTTDEKAKLIENIARAMCVEDGRDDRVTVLDDAACYVPGWKLYERPARLFVAAFGVVSDRK